MRGNGIARSVDPHSGLILYPHPLRILSLNQGKGTARWLGQRHAASVSKDAAAEVHAALLHIFRSGIAQPQISGAPL